MELKHYAAIGWRWLWLIALAIGIAAGSSYLAARQMPKVYQASTTLLVGQSLQNPNPTSELLNISQQLAQTYAQVVTTDPFLQSALDNVGFQMTTDRLRNQVNARNIPGTSLIEVRVVDTDPLRAQTLTNELGHQLVLQSPAANGASDPQRNFIQKQVDELQRNIEEAQLKINQIKGAVEPKEGSVETEDKQELIKTLQNQISGWQQNYAGLVNYLAPHATNYISVIEPARLPTNPIAPNIPLYVFSSAVIGLLLSVCGIFMVEHVEKRMNSDEFSRNAPKT